MNSQKDFDKWGLTKKNVDQKKISFHVHERDIWWFSAGLNIGSEIDGKNDLYERPCVVLKVHSSNTATVIPISTNKEEKKEEYYSFNFLFNEVSQIAVLSQAKLIDFKRCSRYIGRVDQENFKKLKSKFIKYFQYETPLARGISGAEAISGDSISTSQNLSSGQMADKSGNYKEFRLSVQAVILNPAKEVLILKSVEHGVWLLPGGRVDKDEVDLEKVLKRELFEELSIEDVEILQPLGTGLSSAKGTLGVAYLCIIKDLSNLKLNPGEHSEYSWVPKEKLASYLAYIKIGEDINKYLK